MHIQFYLNCLKALLFATYQRLQVILFSRLPNCNFLNCPKNALSKLFPIYIYEYISRNHVCCIQKHLYPLPIGIRISDKNKSTVRVVHAHQGGDGSRNSRNSRQAFGTFGCLLQGLMVLQIASARFRASPPDRTAEYLNLFVVEGPEYVQQIQKSL